MKDNIIPFSCKECVRNIIMNTKEKPYIKYIPDLFAVMTDEEFLESIKFENDDEPITSVLTFDPERLEQAKENLKSYIRD